MTIDEAIAKYREKAEHFKSTTNVTYALELERIAEWLEELKELRKIKEDYAKGMQTSYATFMYNKAIDDFSEKLKRENKETIPTHSGYCRMNFDEVVDEIAEQLMEGGVNGKLSV